MVLLMLRSFSVLLISSILFFWDHAVRAEVLLTQPPVVIGQSSNESQLKLGIFEPAPPEAIYCVKVDAAGDIFIGSGMRGPNNGNFEGFLDKYSGARGGKIWSIQFSNRGYFMKISCMDMTPEGDVVVVTPSTAIYGPIRVAKYSGISGTLVWENLSLHEMSPSDIKVHSNGDIYICGDFANENDSDDTFVAKLSGTDGKTLELFLSKNEFSAAAFSIDHQGNPLLAGRIDSYGNVSNFHTLKLSQSTLLPAWSAFYGVVKDLGDLPEAITSDQEGNVIVTGSTGFLAANYPITAKRDILTIKYAAGSGSVIWSKRFNSALDRDDTGQLIAVDPDGNPIIAGHYGEANATNLDTRKIYLCKYAANDGRIIWEHLYPTETYASTLTSNGDGDVFLTGIAFAPPSDPLKAFCRKYRGTDGALLFEHYYSPPGFTSNSVHGLSLDLEGNWITVGSSYGQIPGYRKIILKHGLPVPSGHVGLYLKPETLGSQWMQRSTDLNHWLDLEQVSQGLHGHVEWVDPAPPAGSAYYRLKPAAD